MNLKRIGKALLFPHTAAIIMLIPVATVLLVYSMVYLGTDSLIAICSYVLAAYTLTVSSVRIPSLIRFIKTFKSENKYARLWLDDAHLRVSVSLYGSLIWNTAYAIFQLCLGIYHRTFWYCSFAIYYIFLAAMRFFLARRYTTTHKAGERMREELLRYRASGIVLLTMNFALSLIVFFMIYWGRTFVHHEITTITMAAYTFTAFTVAIVNIVRYRKYNSPIYSASKAVSLAAASVSMLTLTSTMLTTFGDPSTNAGQHKIALALVGGAVSLCIIIMAVYMIIESNKKLKEMTNGKQE